MMNVIYMENVISITCGAIDAVFEHKNIKESFFLSVYVDRNALKVRINS